MASRSTIWARAVAAAQSVFLQAERTPLRGFLRALYIAVARAAGAYLTWGERLPAVYVRAGLGTGEFIPGRSDIDLAIVVEADRAGAGISSGRVWRRWERIASVLPRTGRLLDEPRVYDELELRDVAGSTAMTYGLDDGHEQRTVLLDGAANVGPRRMLFRPGLYGATSDWRLLSGPERRPREPPRSAQERRIAGWLELSYWWRWAFHVCVDPGAPATPGLRVKLIAEAARIWLWLAHGERFGTRAEALRRALQELPEEHAIRTALTFQQSSHARPEPSLPAALSALLGLSTRIAELIADETAGAGSTAVRLTAPMLDESGSTMPLCDWAALAAPQFPGESFTVQDGDPADPAVLGAAVRAQTGPSYIALRGHGLLVLPARFSERSRGRGIKTAVTDPVSFALAAGSSVARFPEVRGWSAEDTARRAVAEHRALLRRPPAFSPLWMLLSAARAALFLESVRQGEGELAATLRGAGELLAARFPESAVEEAVRSDAVEGVHALVLRLPEYRD